ncbi:MAG: glycerophosphodiester phosphodiesterase family protein [Pseudomonadota bacterium]
MVVIHDERLERTTNGQGLVIEQTITYLRSLDAGQGEKIPLLQEVFELVDRRIGINVELKGPNTAEPTARLLTSLVMQQNWSHDQLLISCFDHHQLKAAKEFEPKLQVGALLAGIPLDYAGCAQLLDAWSIHPSLGLVNKAFVEDAHRRGIKVFPFTLRHEKDVAFLQEIGVDGVFTDYPELIVK